MLSRFRESLRLATKNILLHKMRSTLTVLGIVFGVCSVIAMLAVGEGASWEAQEQIKRLGSSNIIVRSVKPPEDEGTQAARTRLLEYGLTYADMRQIMNTIPGIEKVVPSRHIRRDVYRTTRHAQLRVVGTTRALLKVGDLRVREGRFVSDLDEAGVRNVAVLGLEAQRELFPMGAAFGETIKIEGSRYSVVGVLEKTGSTERDRDIFIPLRTARKRFGENLVKMTEGSSEMERIELHELIVRCTGLEVVLGVADAVRQTMEFAHKRRDWEMIVPLDLLMQARRTRRIFDIVLGSIAAISLLVGGIGIMNIMLATVTERTREIGIRRALGARKRDIMSQFLAETIVLSGGGGIIGLVLGVILPFLIQEFADMRTIVRVSSLVLAFGVSVFVGVVFGIYPARRAAEMDPIEALRHE